MKIIETIQDAEQWFKAHDIPTYVDISNKTIFVKSGNFELELSADEIIYRAELFRELKENDLIKH